MSRSDLLALSLGGPAYSINPRSGSEISGFSRVKSIDDPLVTVPVLGPQEIARQSHPRSERTSEDNPHSSSHGTNAEKTKSKFTLFGRKKSATSNSTVDFVMRPVPRSLYLAHYAKDENGRCVGTGEPAEDCVLGDEDMIKHRAKKTCSASNSGNEVDRSDRGTGQPGGQQNENAGLRTRISDAEHQSFATKRKRGGLCRRLKGGDSDDGFVR